MAVAAAASLAATAAGCGGEHRRVSIALVRGPEGAGASACGAPVGVQGVELFAQGDFVEVAAAGPADAELATELFPASTRALVVRLLGPGSVLVAEGRSGTFTLADLDDGGTIPVLVGPARGFCRVGDLLQGRRRPAATRVGAQVLVVGGADSQGGPVGTAELYDPATGRFALVADAPFDDLRGARALELADGRALVVWEDGFQLFDPDAAAFSQAFRPQGADVLGWAQVARLPDGRVLVAGGCATPGAAPPCAAATTAAIFDPVTLDVVPAPPLAVARADGAAIVDADGRVLLVGGYDASGAPAADAELWAPAAGGSVLPAVAVGAAAPLPAGGLLAVGAPAGAPVAAGAVVVPALAGALSTVSAVAPRAGATLTVLDDGSVLVLGGVDPGAPDATPEAELYRPAAGGFDALVAAPALGARRREHAAVRLDDGTVLVLGGVGDAADVRRDAVIYRHDLTGPWSSVPTQTFAGGAGLLVPDDPAAASVEPADGTHPARLALSGRDLAPAPLAGWVVLAGPRYADVELGVGLGVAGGAGAGAALLLGMTGAGDYVLVELVPGEPLRARAVTLARPGPILCETGAPLAPLDDAAGAHQVRLVRRGDRVEVTVDDGPALVCSDLPTTRGQVGVGLIGGAGDVLHVVAVTATR